MFYLENMCCFCLKSSVPLNDIFSTDRAGLSQFDKIACSLLKIANVVEFDGDLLLCKECCDMIDKIYEFNQVCLKNIDLFTSYKTILQENLNKKRFNVSVKLKKNEGINSQSIETILIKVENEKYYDHIIDKTINSYITDGTAIKNESRIVDEIIIKSEMDDPIEIFDNNDYAFNLINNREIKMDIEEEVKLEYVGKNYKEFMECEKAGTCSEAGGHSSIEFDVELNNKQKLIKEIESDRYLDSHGRESNSPEQLIVGNKEMYNNKKHTCHLCHKIYTQKSHLDRHVCIIFGAKPFACEICKASFNRRFDLNRHMVVHSGEKPHACDMCEKVFNLKSNLSKHKLIHSGVKPFTCYECNKSFRHKRNLAEHKRIHTGEKPYSCDICNKSFRGKSNLNRHKKVHGH